MEQTLSLSYVTLIILRHRKRIASATLITALVAAAISLILPKWYKATASILPPDVSASQVELIGLGQYVDAVPPAIPTLSSPSDIYAAVLQSRRVMDAVIDSLNLIEAFGVKKRHKAAERIRRHMGIEVGLDGVVRIEYEDKDRDRSAAVVNAFISELDRFNRFTRITTAGKLRAFIEKRLNETLKELMLAEENLKRFKEQSGAVVISEQTRVSIETAANLFAKIAALEVQLERLKAYATEKSPEIREVRSQMRALRRKLAEMGYSTADVSDTADIVLFPDFSSAPELEQRLAELTREVEIKNAIYRVLSEQYEQARIQELRNTPSLQVLDWAKPPPVHSRPKRKLIVAVSALFAFLLSSFVVVKRVGLEAATPASENLRQISSIVEQDLASLKRLLGMRRSERKRK